MKAEIWKVLFPCFPHTCQRIFYWLEEHNLTADLVNIYVNDPENITVVLSSRDTALRLKLSLGG